jgi:hypothetical protein
LGELDTFVSDYLDFKEYNHVDNILKTIKNKREQELTDAKLLQTDSALVKFRQE